MTITNIKFENYNNEEILQLWTNRGIKEITNLKEINAIKKAIEESRNFLDNGIDYGYITFILENKMLNEFM